MKYLIWLVTRFCSEEQLLHLIFLTAQNNYMFDLICLYASLVRVFCSQTFECYKLTFVYAVIIYQW